MAFKAIQEKDKVGLVVFGKDVKESIIPTDNFPELLRAITKIKASNETDFTSMIQKSIEMFPSDNVTKHLLLWIRRPFNYC